MAANPNASDQPDDALVECLLCGRRYRSLGHHLVRAHDMTVDQYRDQHGIRRTRPLTAPVSRQRWQEKIAAQIAAGALDAHYAGNAERAAAARPASQRALRQMRALGVPRRPSRPPRTRDELVAIVAAIEAGATRADALAVASISESRFYAAIRCHPDLKARMAGVAERKARRSATAARPGRVAGSEIARIIAEIHRGHPKASLLYTRVAIALLDAPDRTLTVSDLSDALGKGRDSTAVQDAIGRMEAIGVVSRELRPADDPGAHGLSSIPIPPGRSFGRAGLLVPAPRLRDPTRWSRRVPWPGACPLDRDVRSQPAALHQRSAQPPERFVQLRIDVAVRQGRAGPEVGRRLAVAGIAMEHQQGEPHLQRSGRAGSVSSSFGQDRQRSVDEPAVKLADATRHVRRSARIGDDDRSHVGRTATEAATRQRAGHRGPDGAPARVV